jgi:hypothetical protein
MGGIGSGGYKQPMNPAPVSGPGALSERTDGGAIDGMTQPVQQYTGFDYGANKEINDLQGMSPLAGDNIPVSPVVPLGAPTQFPDQPDSYGASWDPTTPGVDTNFVKGIRPMDASNVAYRNAQFDTSGQWEAIYNRINLA